ncbi:MAG: hypothetical protein CL878_13330 [Dehalococcoidia bacterium]|nr:hypothetical protein [Dehalococcoidia bacterium]
MPQVDRVEAAGATPPPRRPQRLIVERLAAVTFLVAALALDVWGTWQLSQHLGAHTDLLPRWYGTRAWILEGRSVYEPEVKAGVFEAMHGRPPRSDGTASELDDFAFGFTYPPYVALVIAPLAVLPLPVATTLWLLIGQASLLAACRLLTWFPSFTPGPSPTGKGESRSVRMGSSLASRHFRWLVLVAVLWPPALANLIFGQFAALVLFLLVAVRSLLLKERPLLAGLCLAAAVVKPQLVVLAVPLLLVAAWRRPGWRRLWLGCLGGITLLLAAGFAVAPDWLAAWGEETEVYARVAAPVSAVGLLLRLTLPADWTGFLTLPLQIGMIALVTWGALLLVRQRPGAGLPEVAGLVAPAIIATSLAIPPLYEWNSVLLLVPLAEALFAIQQRLAQAQRPFWPIIVVVLLLSAVTAPLALAYPSQSRVVWPLLVTAAWLATRRLAPRLTHPDGRHRGRFQS